MLFALTLFTACSPLPPLDLVFEGMTPNGTTWSGTLEDPQSDTGETDLSTTPVAVSYEGCTENRVDLVLSDPSDTALGGTELYLQLVIDFGQMSGSGDGVIVQSSDFDAYESEFSRTTFFENGLVQLSDYAFDCTEPTAESNIVAGSFLIETDIGVIEGTFVL